MADLKALPGLGEKRGRDRLKKEYRNKHLVLFPIRLDIAVTDTDQAWAADIRRPRHIGDFSRWQDHNTYQHAFERLLRALQAKG
ncbi:MAG: hypothetical protein HS126_09800 [Anaerolineales bacterium]|nr:hypothetical protein [Anaerolineales bacterium]